MKQKTDFIFFGLTGLVILSTIILSQFYNYVAYINNYIAYAAWPIALLYRLKATKGKRFSLGILLILGLFNILNFFIFSFNLNISGLVTPINPLMLLIIIIYYFINKKAINNIMSNFFRGSETDKKEAYEKSVNFYLNKFTDCNEEEFKTILADYKDYPAAAQTALNVLQQRRENNA